MARYGEILEQVHIHEESIREKVSALDQADIQAEKDRDEFVDELIGKVVKYEEKANKLAKAVEAKDAEIMKIRENLKVKEAEVVSQTRENKKLAKTLKARDLELKSALELNETESSLLNSAKLTSSGTTQTLQAVDAIRSEKRKRRATPSVPLSEVKQYCFG
jgi:uncharacterized lipoprotein YddW (UPF0748 family)